MEADKTDNDTMRLRPFALGVIGALNAFVAGCVQRHIHPTSPNTPGCEVYAAFFAEIAGAFASPLDVDAPRRYAWVTKDGTAMGGSLGDMWPSFGDTTLEHNATEVLAINHLSSKGWSLVDYEVATTHNKRQDLHTVYRYLFKRPCPPTAPSSDNRASK